MLDTHQNYSPKQEQKFLKIMCLPVTEQTLKEYPMNYPCTENMRKPVSIKMRNHVNKVLQMSPMVNTSMKVMSTGAPLLVKDKITKKAGDFTIQTKHKIQEKHCRYHK